MKIDNEWLQKHLVSGEEIDSFEYIYRKPANRLECVDGESLSVQASKTHYSTPKSNYGPYTHVEVGFPSVYPHWWEGGDDVMGYVPVNRVVAFINVHGGVKP